LYPCCPALKCSQVWQRYEIACFCGALSELLPCGNILSGDLADDLVGDASIPVAQCNNIYIFPGVGLAVTAAAAAVGDAATIRHDPHGTLLPGRAQLASTATAVAGAVAKAAVADAVAPALTDDQIDQAIGRARWLPRYQSLSTSVLIN
jgi:Malic enzyme, NAD binding domain